MSSAKDLASEISNFSAQTIGAVQTVGWQILDDIVDASWDVWVFWLIFLVIAFAVVYAWYWARERFGITDQHIARFDQYFTRFALYALAISFFILLILASTDALP